MKTQLWVYLVVGLLSVGAAVAIAGVPSFESRESTIQPATDTTTTTPTTEAPLFEPAGTTTESADDDDADQASDTADADAGDEATEPSTTSTTSTTTTTTSTTVPLAERTEVEVVVANGAEVGGAATDGSNALEAAGYGDVGSFDGSEIVDITVIYAVDGLQGEAERLAEDIGIDTTLVFPLATAPDIGGLGDSVQIVVYLGRDIVDNAFFG